MLGVALNAQRAGWGEQPFVVNITTDSVVSQALYQTPSYSFLFNASDRNWDVSPGDYNLTGYSSISGFNNSRYTGMMNLYFPWPSGLADGYYGNPFGVQINKTGDSMLFWTVALDIVSGSLQIKSGYDNISPVVTLTGAYTDYTNRWLTFVATGAETSSVFTNWTGTGSGSNYNRLAVYDTETAVLLGKTDTIDSSRRANISGYGNSVSSIGADADAVVVAGFSGGGEQIRQAGIWFSLGTMFDPLTETSDVWLTTRPGATVGNATAWLNSTATTYYEDTGPNNYYMDEDTDIFIPDTANQRVKIADSDAAFTTGYSTTIIPKDQS
jgi:hypothetical protein